MLIKIIPNEFNPWKYLQEHELQAGKFGAAATFIGTMRDYNVGDTVKSMFLEHYPNMTEKYLQQISHIALQRWDILDTLIVHRVGEILPGDNIVLVAVWAGHRVPAFEACRFLMEELKAKAPFWKRETLVDDKIRWVDAN
ncbi:MAG: molybdenum cofactor biosynthesis protein MoaE [Candidatus Marithrix sp.]